MNPPAPAGPRLPTNVISGGSIIIVSIGTRSCSFSSAFTTRRDAPGSPPSARRAPSSRRAAMRGAHAPTASASPLEDDLPGVVKRMNRVSDFETACVEISRRVRAARDAPDPPHDALFAAVMRAGVVLRTRHAETSPGWHFGAALFAEAEETFRERPVGDVEKIATLARVARAAVDDAAAASEEENPKAPEENPRPTARRAFEGQLSGEVEREFDRPRVGNNGNNDGPTDVDAPFDPAQPDAEALVAMLRRAEATLAAEGEGSGGGASTRASARRRHPGSAASASISALASRTRTLDDARDVEALGDGAGGECPICRDAFAVGARVVAMPCSHRHVFHRACVAEWLERDDSCPLCRSALPVWLGRETQYA